MIKTSFFFEKWICQKTIIFYPLIRTRTFAYQGVRNASFSEGFAYKLNEWLFSNESNSSDHERVCTANLLYATAVT